MWFGAVDFATGRRLVRRSRTIRSEHASSGGYVSACGLDLLVFQAWTSPSICGVLGFGLISAAMPDAPQVDSLSANVASVSLQ